MKLVFFTGSNLELSKQEIKSFFGESKIFELRQGLLFLDLEISEEELKKAQEKLGSVLKIGEVIFEGNLSEAKAFGVNLLKEKRESKEGKLRIGLNFFGKNLGKKISFLKDVKKVVSSCRFLNNGEKNLESVVTKKQVLEKDGVELNFLEVEKVCLVKTLSVQDVDSYGKRDFGKPFRSAKVGMLPPKLAQILINLSGAKKSLWDPFCGSGTVLLEATLAGFEKVYGSDLSEKMVEASEGNLAWLKEIFDVGDFKSEIFLLDVKERKKVEVEAVVTEGYLGIPLEDFATQSFIEKNDKVISEIWEKALENFAKNKIEKAVLCLPCYSQKNGKRIFCEKTLEKIKLSKYTPLAEKLVYGRKDQFVHRQILILELNL